MAIIIYLESLMWWFKVDTAWDIVNPINALAFMCNWSVLQKNLGDCGKASPEFKP